MIAVCGQTVRARSMVMGKENVRKTPKRLDSERGVATMHRD